MHKLRQVDLMDLMDHLYSLDYYQRVASYHLVTRRAGARRVEQVNAFMRIAADLRHSILRYVAAKTRDPNLDGIGYDAQCRDLVSSMDQVCSGLEEALSGTHRYALYYMQSANDAMKRAAQMIGALT